MLPVYPLIVIVGPAAVGKTTVVKTLLKKYPLLKSTVTYTTRQPRQKTGGEDKVMVHVSVDDFLKRKAEEEFIESAMVHGEWYGTHAEETLLLLETNPVIFNIDIQGMVQIKQRFGKRAISIFIAPESMDTIVRRLRARGESTEEDFQARLKSAELELQHQDDCDYKIVNIEGKIQETIDHISAIIEPLFTLDKNLSV